MNVLDIQSSDTGQEVLAIRYGTRRTTKAENFLNWHVYDEPDETFEMDYFFWVVRNAERTIIVDCGFDPDVGHRRGRTVLVDPIDALAAIGIDAAKVDRVVVTHAHYDHIGTLNRFPNAEIIMTRRELEFWAGPYARRPQFAHATETRELALLERLHEQGQVSTFEGSRDLGGLRLIEVGGHTPGQLIALADLGNPAEPAGTAVLAADALHFYAELDTDRPFFVVADLQAMYAGFDTLGQLCSAPNTVLIAGHDADVRRRFPQRAAGTGIDDLVIRIDASDALTATGENSSTGTRSGSRS